MLAIVLVVIVIAAVIYFGMGKRPPNTPPGPTGIPFFGYAPFLGGTPWIPLTALKPKYGNVMSMFLGKTVTIVLQDYEAIKAAFLDQEDVFAGRGEQFITDYFASGKDKEKHGIMSLEGPRWQATKNFVTSTANEFLANSRFEEICLEEVDQLAIAYRKESSGFDPHPRIYHTMWNIVGRLMYDRRMDFEEFNFFTKEAHDLFEALAGGPLQIFPWLRFIVPGQGHQWKNSKKSIEKQWDLFEKEIEKHEQTYNTTQVRDFIDAFFRHQRGEDNKSPLAMKNKNDFIATVEELLLAGSESTAATIQWALLYLLYYPDCMKKVQEELDHVIGRDRPITLEDKPSIPYTVATYYECMRLGGNSAVGVMRSTLVDTELLGYFIPERSYVMPNIYATHRDPRYFPDPDTFNPNRFLGPDGKLNVPPQFILFSMGKRSCPGQELARTMVFLVFANLLQRFDFTSPPPHKLAPLDKWIPGISARSLPYEIEARPRF